MDEVTVVSELGSPDTTDRPACTACGQAGAQRDPFYYDWRQHRYWIYRCRRCTHQFVYPQVAADQQAEIYGDQYFSAAGDWVCGMFHGGYFEAEVALRDEANQVLDLLPLSSGKLLDVGCAGGVFLDEARRRGFEVAGIELNPTMAERARKTFGLQVLTSRIEDVPPDTYSEAFDIVTLLDCLEHVPQPLDAVKKIAGWIRPEGYLFIRGPLSNSRVAWVKDTIRRVLRLSKRLPGYPLDANVFNKRSFRAVLDTAGFEGLAWPHQSSKFSNLVARKL